MKHSPQILLLSTLLALAACNVSYRSGYDFSYKGSTASFKKQDLIPEAIKRVHIDHRFGDLHVSPSGPGESPGWRWELTTWADDQGLAQSFMDQITLETISEGDRMSWTLQLPESPGSELNGIKSNLWLRVAMDTEVELENRHGDATLVGLGGKIKSDVAHGDASYQALSGALWLQHAHGDVELEDVQSGRLHLEHSRLDAMGFGQSFELIAEHSQLKLSKFAAGLSLEASHSSSELTEVHGRVEFDGNHSKLKLSGDPEQLLLESSHGDLDVVCAGSSLHSVRARSEHSDFNLTLPAESNVQLKSRAEHGSAESDIPSGNQGPPIEVDVKIEYGDFRLRAAGR